MHAEDEADVLASIKGKHASEARIGYSRGLDKLKELSAPRVVPAVDMAMADGEVADTAFRFEHLYFDSIFEC